MLCSGHMGSGERRGYRNGGPPIPTQERTAEPDFWNCISHLQVFSPQMATPQLHSLTSQLCSSYPLPGIFSFKMLPSIPSNPAQRTLLYRCSSGLARAESSRSPLWTQSIFSNSAGPLRVLGHHPMELLNLYHPGVGSEVVLLWPRAPNKLMPLVQGPHTLECHTLCRKVLGILGSHPSSRDGTRLWGMGLILLIFVNPSPGGQGEEKGLRPHQWGDLEIKYFNLTHSFSASEMPPSPSDVFRRAKHIGWLHN